MRRVLVAILLLPLASGQLLTDQAGDVQVVVGPESAEEPGVFGYADLLALWVTEDDDGFTFQIDMGPQDQADARLDSRIYLRHGGHEYLIRIESGLDGPVAILAQWDEGQQWYVTQRALMVTVPQPDSYAVLVEHAWLLDEFGAPPGLGDLLEDIHVESDAAYVSSGREGTVSRYDQMPDEGGTWATWAVTSGPAQEGDLRLSSPRPFRATNGAQPTFVYTINATNTGTGPMDAVFEVETAPPNWDVRMASWSLRLGPGASRNVPLVLDIPTAHAHDKIEGMTVALRSADGDTGRIRLGIHYLSVPQPAGHHDTVTLHRADRTTELSAVFESSGYATGNRFQSFFVNTLQEDPASTGGSAMGETCDMDAVPVGPANLVAEGATYCWWVPLVPVLELGLHVDGTRTGTAELSLQSDVPADVHLSGQWLWLAPTGSTNTPWGQVERVTVILGSIEADPVTLGAGQATTITSTIQPNGTRVVPYQDGASMVFHIKAHVPRVQANIFGPHVGPSLAAGGSMRLPLQEYQDPVDAALLASDLTWHVPVAERAANPGKTIVFEPRLQNEGGLALTATIQAAGPVAQVSTIQPHQLRIDAGGSAAIQVAVEVPKTVVHGDLLPIVLLASTADGASQAAASLAVRIVEDVDVADEKELVHGTSGKESPLAPWLALGALAIAGRRRFARLK